MIWKLNHTFQIPLEKFLESGTSKLGTLLIIKVDIYIYIYIYIYKYKFL